MENIMNEIRNKTTALHKAAEITGFNKRLIDKNATKETYAEYIYNLLFVYEAIEENLEKYSDNNSVNPFVTKELYKSKLIREDIKVLLGENSNLELLSSTIAYVSRINESSRANPKMVIAHAYTRFLADLFGGRTFYSLLKEYYKLEDNALNYYQFNEINDLRDYVMVYHNKLKELSLDGEEKQLFINEISNSYIYNIAISNELESKHFK
ncbi:heme oxygenase (biliverdin-producing) [Clostridium sp.]|uniref:biliverdin-producing heme oxygenase n=1 Tax=Clostridium sp. TaxID=1506 RepID=UPI002619909A|nr:biliverdin-producing heme oxygenase [Clostridium sp.]